MQEFHLPTPFWRFDYSLPEGIYEWCLTIKNERPFIQVSNRGGYQCEPFWGLDAMPLEYRGVIEKALDFIPNYNVDNWWINVNNKGDYNLKHTHPNTDLVAVWYITDDDNEFFVEDPFIHTRSSMYRTFNVPDNRSFNTRAGGILVHPGDVNHWVESHKSDKPRITIGFNITVCQPR